MTYTSTRPPVQYPGGKRQVATRIVNLIRRSFPEHERLYSPFLGGGAVELRWSNFTRGEVIAADYDKPLTNLWTWVLLDAPAVAAACLDSVPLDARFWQKNYPQLYADYYHGTFENAVTYWLLRRIKVPNAWGLSHRILSDFNKKHRGVINLLRQFRAPRFHVYHCDFDYFIGSQRKDSLLYCDPPFVGLEDVYMYHKKGQPNDAPTFSHQLLFERLRDKEAWVLSYGDHPWVRETYRDYRLIEVPVKYENRRFRDCSPNARELLIVSR